MSPQIRVDEEAKDRLDSLHEEWGGTKTGLASEAIRRGLAEMRESKGKEHVGKGDNGDGTE